MNRNERSVPFLLSVIAVLLAANLLVSINKAGDSRVAMAAGIPDSGAQLQAVVDKISDLNKEVDRLDSFLESGALTVKMADPKAEK